MPQGLEDIKATLGRITQGDTMIDLLMEFERTLDATELFVYKNWSLGELVKGPEITRYWFTTSWMYPHALMPDPEGALRMEKIGCKVLYEKDTLLQPRRVMAPKDWDDPSTKSAKIEELPVWVVTIEMPMKYVTDRLDMYSDMIDDAIGKDDESFNKEMEPEQEPEQAPMADEFGGGMEDFGEEEL